MYDRGGVGVWAAPDRSCCVARDAFYNGPSRRSGRGRDKNSRAQVAQ